MISTQTVEREIRDRPASTPPDPTLPLVRSALLAHDRHDTMDGPPPPEEDFTSLPVADRLAHKNWKARVSGYDTLIKTFQNTASDSDPAFRPYVGNGELLKKIVADTNAVAQEKGVEVVVALVKFAGENAARTREEVMPAVVDKCLGSTRAGTRTQAVELVLQYVEMENSADGSIVRILLVSKDSSLTCSHKHNSATFSLASVQSSPRL